MNKDLNSRISNVVLALRSKTCGFQQCQSLQPLTLDKENRCLYFFLIEVILLYPKYIKSKQPQ